MASRILIPPATSPVFPNHCAACLREPAGYHETALELTAPVMVNRGGIQVVAGHQTVHCTCAVPYCSRHLRRSLRLPRLIRTARRNCIIGAIIVSGVLAAGTAQVLYMYTYLMERRPPVFAGIVGSVFVAAMLLSLPLLPRFMYRLCGLLLPAKAARGGSEHATLGLRLRVTPTSDGDSQLAITIANPEYAELFRRVNRN